jgi:hypothetical protein
MTKRELIEKRIPYPLSDMVIRNCDMSLVGNYLNEEARDNAKVHDMLGGLFLWFNSPEGFEFWDSLRSKLQAKNL